MDDEEDILNVDFDPIDLENVDEDLLLGGITPPSLNVTKTPVDLEKSTESISAPENSSLAVSQEDPGSAKTATVDTTPELSKSHSNQVADDVQLDSQQNKTSDDSEEEEDEEEGKGKKEDRLKFKTEQTNIEQKRFFTRTGIPDSLDDVKLPELKKFNDNRYNRSRSAQNFKKRGSPPQRQHFRQNRHLQQHQSRDSNQQSRDIGQLKHFTTGQQRHHPSQFVGLRAKGVGTVLLNPHFKGSVKADANVRLAWDVKAAGLIESRDLLKTAPPSLPLIGGLLVSSSPLAMSPRNLNILPSIPPPPIPLLPTLGGFKGQPPPPPQPIGARPVGGANVLSFPASIPTGQPPPPTPQHHVIARQSLMATSVARMGPPTMFSSVLQNANPSPPSILHHHGAPKSIFDPSKPPPLIGPRHGTGTSGTPGSSPANDVIVRTDKNDWLGLTEDFLRKIQTKKVQLDRQDYLGGPGVGSTLSQWGRGRSGSSSRYSSSGGSSASGSRKQQAAEHIRRKYRISNTGAISKLKSNTNNTGWGAQVEFDLRQALSGNESHPLYDDDYLRKLEEQKRLREELNRRKEMRRQQEIAKKQENVALKRTISKTSEESFDNGEKNVLAEKKEPQQIKTDSRIVTKMSTKVSTSATTTTAQGQVVQPAKKIIRLNSSGAGGNARKVIPPSSAITKTIFQRAKNKKKFDTVS